MTPLRQTICRLFRAPAFTLTSVLTLAIAIGATTAIFSVVNGVLVQPLPFPESDRLVALSHRSPRMPGNVLPASPSLYFTYREHNRTFESVALWSADTASVTGMGSPEEVRALIATHEFLPTLRVEPLVGRSFTEADDQPGAASTVMLSHAYWQRRFGGSADVLGRTLTVDGAPHTVIGVLPQSFRLLQRPADVLLPMQPDRAIAFVGPLGEEGIARLRPGVTLDEASADVDRMIPIMMETFPAVPGMDMRTLADLRLQPNLRPLKDFFVRDLADVLWVLMGTIGMLLLIACANVANLQLVRTERRGRELAIRAALGAEPAVIGRGLLLESVLLGLAGGALGLVLANVGLPVLLAVAGQDLPGVLEIAIDSNVLLFALGISLISGAFFGLLPMIRHAAPRIVATLGRAGPAHSATREQHRLRNALVVAQVSIALVLLVAAGLMIRTYVSLHGVDPGFSHPATVQVVDISIPEAQQPDFSVAVRMQNRIQDRLAAISGVESAAFASRVPLDGQGPSSGFFIEDNLPPTGEAPESREFRFASPGFFETLGTPIMAGRSFDWRDNYEGRPVALVSANLARREWGSPQAALGKRFRMVPTMPWREIVGVVGDIHHEGLDRPAAETFYLPMNHTLAQWMSRSVSFVLRSERAGTAALLEDVQEAIWSVDPGLPLASVETLAEIHSRALARTSLTMLLLGITGAMALLLGLVGIYGVISYILTQRTAEMGIRMALGAQAAQLKRLLLGHVLALVGVGVAVGLAAAGILTRLMESLLFGVTALDVPTYAGVAAVLVATAAVAGWLPARRAARIDPMRALREE
ncbi:MAG: ABC transporter permease [Gammaproteobacteria bacterium]|nr:ABC transporter permease [Gammaproteobacteria bacterium]